MKTALPTRAKVLIALVPTAVVKTRLRSRSASIIACGWRSWRRRKTAPSARPDGDAGDPAELGAVRGPLLDAVDGREDRRQRQHRAEHVERRAAAPLPLREQHGADDEQQRHRREVHEEHRAPPEVREQHAAEHRAETDAGGHHAGPDADRLAALALVVEQGPDHRHGRRHQGRAADAEQGAGGDQLAGRLRRTPPRGRWRRTRRRRSAAAAGRRPGPRRRPW